MYVDDKVFMTALVMTVVLLRTFKPVSSLANSGRGSSVAPPPKQQR
jgi:hypothetical protein